MKKYDTVLFDMDGTLCNTKSGIKNTIKKVLLEYGVDDFSLSENEYIGPPLLDVFFKLLGDWDKAKEALSQYRSCYKVSGVYENELYEGMYDLIVKLKENNFKIALASLKPEVFCVEILKQHNIIGFFDFISCATLDGKIGDKAKIIDIAINGLKAKREKAVMVGDTVFDLIGARENNIDAIFASYGFGDEGNLGGEKAVLYAKSVDEIRDFLL